jgi:hypothetical protein
MARAICAAPVAALALTVATSASADPKTKPEESAPPPSATWYGLETLAVDGAGLLAGGIATATLDFSPRHEPPKLGLMAGVWYGVGAVGAPAVHYAHGNTGLGMASLGFRALVPPVTGFFGLIGVCVGRGDFEHDCVVDGYVGGTIVGLASAAAVDAGLLAWDPPPRKDEPERNWYGAQILAVDAGTLAFGAYIASSEPRTKSGQKIHPGLATWVGAWSLGLLGGPIVHFVHGRVGAGFGSFGLRAIAGPLGAVPGLMGYCAATAGTRGCTETGAAWGLVGGLVAIDLLDALVLAHEKVDAKTASERQVFVGVGPGTLSVGGYLPR